MTRWEQRLVNFNKQLNSFEDSLVQKEFSELELSGLVQQFNLTIMKR